MSSEGPERMCIGCRRRRPQAELVRCALRADGQAVVSRTATGRGAWLCPAPGNCFDAARRRTAFARAWRRDVEPRALDELLDAWAGAT